MLLRLLLLLAIIIWGWTFIATKILLAYFSPIEILGLRFLLGAPTLYIILRSQRQSLLFSGAQWRIVLYGGLILTVHLFVQSVALLYTSAVNTGWIVGVTPLALAILAFVFLKEKITSKTVLGIAISTVGIALLISEGILANLSWMNSRGDWLAIISAHTFALYTIVTRDISRAHNPLAVTLAVLLPATAITLGYMLFTTDWSSLSALPLEGVAALLFLGILGTAFANWFWQIGIARIGATKSGMFLYLEPLATTALAVPYLNEQFGIYSAIGGALLLAGVYLGVKKKIQP